MKRLFCVMTLTIFSMVSVVGAQDNVLYQHLQDVSVTVKAAGGEGSGVIVTREV